MDELVRFLGCFIVLLSVNPGCQRYPKSGRNRFLNESHPINQSEEDIYGMMRKVVMAWESSHDVVLSQYQVGIVSNEQQTTIADHPLDITKLQCLIRWFP